MHHHMKMFVKFFEIVFVNYKVPNYDSEKVSDGYFESKLAQKKYEGGSQEVIYIITYMLRKNYIPNLLLLKIERPETIS